MAKIGNRLDKSQIYGTLMAALVETNFSLGLGATVRAKNVYASHKTGTAAGSCLSDVNPMKKDDLIDFDYGGQLCRLKYGKGCGSLS